jgi:hypothetical protein
MTVKALIEALQDMPQDVQVFHLWDGEPRTCIEHVWLARAGYVMTADHAEVCYSDDPRPASAPTCKEMPYWETPPEPLREDE